MAWAPGKGTKGKEFKEFWEVDVGSSYIPWDRIPPNIDLEPLEEGAMIDEESLPVSLVEQRKQKMIQRIEQEKADQLLKEQTIAAEKLRAEAEAQAAAILAQNPLPATITLPPSIPQMNLPQSPMMIPPVSQQPPQIQAMPPGAGIPTAMSVTSTGPPPGAIPLEQFKNMVSYPIQKAINKLQSSKPSGPPLLPSPGHLGMSGPPPPLPMYSGPPLAVPPPQVLSGQPPPPLPWGARPPIPPVSALTGSNAQPLGFQERKPLMGQVIVPPLAPHLRPAVPPLNSSMPLPSRIHPADLPPALHDTGDRSSNDDPFAPSLYELKNMNRGRPGPYPMESGRSALLGRFEDASFSNRNRFYDEKLRGPRNSWNDDSRNDWRRSQVRDDRVSHQMMGPNWQENSDDSVFRTQPQKGDDSIEVPRIESGEGDSMKTSQPIIKIEKIEHEDHSVAVEHPESDNSVLKQDT